ncbi:MAG TPA: aminodeoxychorismate lyase [Verrucomicrobiae bacterium]|nr:aminodeoxychorismate lyase [Verrucomicrobiae bacterium]
MSDSILFNGETGEPPLALHRGLAYGDGVFRTCLIYDSHVIDLEEQIRKLTNDAAALDLKSPSPDVLALEARELARGRASGVLKILLMRAGGERGYRSRTRQADRLLCRSSAPSFPATYWGQGVRVVRTGFRLAAQPALAGIKHLNRLEQVLASRELPADAAEGLVNDANGDPVSGTRTNLFWVEDGVVRTPPLDHCGVAGLMRQKVLEAAQALGIAVRVARGAWQDVESAPEAFVTNSVIGLWPVASFGERRWAAPGPVTSALSAHLAHPRLEERP